MKKLTKVLYWFTFIILFFIAVLTALSAFDLQNGIRILTVQSGSMSPSIPTGSIVIIQPAKEYKKGDVITYKAEKDLVVKNPRNTVTHRIYEVKENNSRKEYITKGDANKSPDSNIIRRELILGKVFLSIPLIGFPVSFAKTLPGLIILIVIPATIIIYSEALSIKNETVRLLAERKKRKLTLKEKIEEKIGEEIIAVEKKVDETLKTV